MNKRILAKFIGFGLLFSLSSFGLHSSFAQETGPATANQSFDAPRTKARGLRRIDAERSRMYQFFYQGNSAYKEGKYEVAIDHYEKIVSLGLENGNLYYNLGNSYFKKEEWGKAVLNYEKALFFIPNNSDLKSNHEYILSSLNLGSQFFGNWFEKFANMLFKEATVNFLTILLSAIYIIAILALICNLFFRGGKRSIKVLFLILIVLFVLSATALNSKITYLNKGAIVISKEADVKFEPIEGATTYFKLTEGNKVEIVEKAENWYKIKRPDGKIGWINKRGIGLIADNCIS